MGQVIDLGILTFSVGEVGPEKRVNAIGHRILITAKHVKLMLGVVRGLVARNRRITKEGRLLKIIVDDKGCVILPIAKAAREVVGEGVGHLNLNTFHLGFTRVADIGGWSP